MAELSLNHHALTSEHCEGRRKLPAVSASPLQLPSGGPTLSAPCTQASGTPPREGLEQPRAPASAAQLPHAQFPQSQAAINHQIEEVIWRMTGEYLRKLQSVCCSPGCPSAQELASRIVQRFAAGDTQQCDVVRLAADALDTSPGSSKRRAGCPHSALPCKSAKPCSLRPEATERRFCCFLCPAVFPFKKNLVRHFQEDHGISRSQALLLKGLNQGAEHSKALYIDPQSK